jgi:hypothetical protein
MAKVDSPLFSVAAHGTIAGALTFSKRRTSNQVRYQKSQTDKITTARSLQRIKFGVASRIWANLTPAQKDQLKDLLYE